MRRLLFLLAIIWSGVLAAAPQKVSSPVGRQDLLLQGYSKTISGNTFYYHSPIESIKNSLIVRAQDGNQVMEWETQAVPASNDKAYTTFVWVAGMGVNLGNHPMELSINGEKAFTFQTERRKNWDYTLKDGKKLSFCTTMTDGANDYFGFMFLRIPSKQVTPGKTLKLAIRAGKSNSSAWYMTFQAPIESGITFKSFPAIFKEKGQEKQAINANVIHFDQPVKATVYADGKAIKKLNLQFGQNSFQVGLPVVTSPKEVTMVVKVGRKELAKKTVTLNPVKKWTVNLVQHSHTDIGYTRPQTEIMAEHLRYIDYALDFCDATDAYPEDAKFRWTCEAAWAVNEYIRSRPTEQINRLKSRIKEGRIEVTGMYFNFDEMPDEVTLAESLKPIKRFKKEGLPVVTAMQNDVNGIGWCFNDYFNSVGVKYLSMGTHGHRALICFDKPTAFWWESPSGNRMLAFRGEHYTIGNAFGIHTGKLENFEPKMLHYLTELQGKDYPYDIIPIQYSGYLTDNSPPSTIENELIKKWNEKYEWPKLRSATAQEFFTKIEKEHSDDLPIYRGAWPDWWTDGFASGAREAAASRQTHVDMIANQGALSMASIMEMNLPEGIESRLYEVNKALLFYDEHTFGSSESVRDPYGLSTMEQRALKESYVWEAFRRSRMVREEAMGLLQFKAPRQEVPSIVVYNSLNWKRSGLHVVYIDHQVLPTEHPFRILDNADNEVAAQPIESRSDGTYWALWVKDVPAMGYTTLRVEVDRKKEITSKKQNTSVPEIMENQWYKVTIDKKKGVITSIFDKELGLEIVDPKAPWALGSFIYERLGNRAQMEGHYMKDYKREGLSKVSVDRYSQGPIWNGIEITGETEACHAPNGFTCEIRLYNTEKRIGFEYALRKKAITDPEGIYIAFPFHLNDGKIYFDVQGGEVEAGVDQIPGSSNDWNTVQNYAAVRNGKAQILLCSPEIPLMQFGGINTGRYKAGATPETTHMYSWPMNNYWVTNFNADQRGLLKWHYEITSTSNASATIANQFGWGTRIPFLSRVLPEGKDNGQAKQGSLLSLSNKDILLVNAQPSKDGKGIILHLRETAGKGSSITCSSELKDLQKLPLQEVNVLGETLGSTQESISFKPFELKFVKVLFK